MRGMTLVSSIVLHIRLVPPDPDRYIRLVQLDPDISGGGQPDFDRYIRLVQPNPDRYKSG